jgi:mannose-6-phosphate isomerase-like protein (cupin superfamily)
VKEVVQYFKLPLLFDTARLREESQGLAMGLWKQHYNRNDYEGSWSVIPLRSFMGLMEANFSAPVGMGGENRYRDTELMPHCPYIQEVLAALHCEKTAVRLMNLAAGAVIKEHRDDALALEEGEARLHIPVQTNADVAFYVEDERVPLQEGECWYLNLSLRHRVHNLGSTDRIHLVVDCLVNDWLMAQLDTPGIVKKNIQLGHPSQQHTPEERQQIIAQLKSMGTPMADELAARMEAEGI